MSNQTTRPERTAISRNTTRLTRNNSLPENEGDNRTGNNQRRAQSDQQMTDSDWDNANISTGASSFGVDRGRDGPFKRVG